VLALQGRGIVKDLARSVEGIGPKIGGGGRWPMVLSMEQHGACLLLEIVDAALSDSILPVGIDTTEGDVLVCLSEALLPGIIGEPAIAGMIAPDFEATFASIQLKGLLSLEGFLGGGVFLELDKPQSTVMIDKDGGRAIAALGEVALELRNESHLA
jgi:hypothetical protein